MNQLYQRIIESRKNQPVSSSNQQCLSQSTLLRLEPDDVTCKDGLAFRHPATRPQPPSIGPRSKMNRQTFSGDNDWTPGVEFKITSASVCSEIKPCTRDGHGENLRYDTKIHVGGSDKPVAASVGGDGVGRKAFSIDSSCPPRLQCCYNEDGHNAITYSGATLGKPMRQTTEWTDCMKGTETKASPSDRSELEDITGIPDSRVLTNSQLQNRTNNCWSASLSDEIADGSEESPEFNACFPRSLNIINSSSLDIMTHVSGDDQGINDEATTVDHEAFRGELWVHLNAESNHHDIETSTDKSRKNKYFRYRSLLGEPTKHTSPKSDKYRATKISERPNHLWALSVASPGEQDLYEKLDERLENLRSMNDIDLLQRELDRLKESTKTTAVSRGTRPETSSKWKTSPNLFRPAVNDAGTRRQTKHSGEEDVHNVHYSRFKSDSH